MVNKEATLKISAIHCEGCATTIKRRLQTLPSVSVTGVDAASKSARFTFDESQVSLERITESLEEIGFSPDDQ